MTTCTLLPAEKKSYAIDVGKILVKKFGKKNPIVPHKYNKLPSKQNMILIGMAGQ